VTEDTGAPCPEDHVPRTRQQVRRIKGAPPRSRVAVGGDPADVFVDHVVQEFPEARKGRV